MRIAHKSNIALLTFGLIASSVMLSPIMAQSSDVLDGYIKQGIDNNLALQQKELDLEKSLHALKEANGLFYPSVTVEAQYFWADGGRSIDFPIGDMLNPVYSSLNQILQSMGQTGEFPQIANEKIEFLPDDYHDTKVRVIMPLVNTEIYYNRKIKKEMINVAQAEVNVYKRELVKEIKTAYIRYLQAVKVVEAYQSALELVTEAKRVNNKLVENQMAGPEKLYRIEAELNQVKAQLTKAENDRNTVASYFNFLLNQPLQSVVITDSILINAQTGFHVTLNTIGIRDREEIAQLNSVLKSSDYLLKLKRSWLIPSVSNITDLGYQGYSYKFDKEQQYIMNTINLAWPIFNGFQNKNRIAQARMDYESYDKRLTETEQQIELQCLVAEDKYESSARAEEANRISLTSSGEYYKVVSRQYAVGQKSLLDLLDARNQLTNAQIGYTISHFETLIRMAELERASASYDLSLFN